jgi:hypothetical protein
MRGSLASAVIWLLLRSATTNPESVGANRILLESSLSSAERMLLRRLRAAVV